ncbi:MAG: hypothetical protein HC853_09810 [Anaerolineae bacterium]|nr:hypothetical protein [Anaerolineae bacterium]
MFAHPAWPDSGQHGETLPAARTGRERVTYLHPLMEPALKDSLGVIIWQEQILQVARDVAGFDPARGELLRRALGHKRSAEQLATFKTGFVMGAMAKGVPEALAHKIYSSIEQMGHYSFARSHALSFALITYWHAWLHAKYPAAFFAATLANMPMGMYPVATLLAEAKRRGVSLLRPDINASAARPTLAAIDTIRLGLASVEGLSEESAQAIVQARGETPFTNLADILARTDMDRHVAEQLILAGALDELHGVTTNDVDPAHPHRRQLIWDLVAAYDLRDAGRLPLPHEAVRLKPFTKREQMSYEFGALSGVVEGHLADLRAEDYAQLDLTHVPVLNTLKAGTKVRIGGICTVPRRPPTASGTCFIMVDTANGISQVIVPRAIYERDRAAIRSGFIVVEGRVQRRHGNVTVAAEKVMRV